MGGNLISWSANKQPNAHRSSIESECRSLSHVCAKTVWVSHLLQELHLPINTPITLYCEYLSTIYMASNPVFHARTKKIDLDYQFVLERVTSGNHHVQFVSLIDQIIGHFTKGPHKQRFELLRSKFIHRRPSSLRWSVRTIWLILSHLAIVPLIAYLMVVPMLFGVELLFVH